MLFICVYMYVFYNTDSVEKFAFAHTNEHARIHTVSHAINVN